MVVTGFGFDQTAGNYSCFFHVGASGMNTTVSVTNATHLTCPTPEWGAQFPGILVKLDLLREGVPVAYFAGGAVATTCAGGAG